MGALCPGFELLYQPEVVRLYLSLLTESRNFNTLEAAAGALQNLSAGNWMVRGWIWQGGRVLGSLGVRPLPLARLGVEGCWGPHGIQCLPKVWGMELELSCLGRALSGQEKGPARGDTWGSARRVSRRAAV